MTVRFITTMPRDTRNLHCARCQHHQDYVAGIAFDRQGVWLAWACEACGAVLREGEAPCLHTHRGCGTTRNEGQ